MQRDLRNQLLALVILQLLWGLVLWFSISKYGLGVSTDAVHQLFGGLNLASGNGLTSYDGSTLTLWPPLYPVLLAAARRLSGVDMLMAALLVQALAFLAISCSLAFLFLRIFPRNMALAVVATLLAQAGSVVTVAFGMVGPDYVHLALVTMILVLTGRYVETASSRVFVALAAVGILVTMQRYLGAAAIAASAATILLLGSGRLPKRLLHAAILSCTALPMGVWLFVTSQLYTRRDPISLPENFGWFSRSILGWFLEPGIPKRQLQQLTVPLWLVVLVVAAVALVLTRRGSSSAEMPPSSRQLTTPGSWAYLKPLLLYGSFYGLALFGSASIAYFNKLGGRFLLPLYLPLIILPVVAADGILRRGPQAISAAARIVVSAACYLGLAALTFSVLRNTLPLVIESHANGSMGGENVYNNRQWRENPALQFWKTHTPAGNYLLLSNEPEGIAFHTWHAADQAPRKRAGPYAKEELPLSGYASELFESGRDVFLIWMKPNPYDHYYTPDEVAEIAVVKPLFTNEGGDVYELGPKGAQ